jgi:subtilisin-like proprotein convertase family protein
LVPHATAQCVTGGAGGSFGPGGAGVWDTTLPSTPLVSALSVTVPTGATVLNSVVLHGLTHTWGGDVHVVLQAPGGQSYNVLVRSDASSPGGGGCADAFSGDYTIVDPLTLSVCGGPGNPSMGCGAGTIAPGTYIQDFSTWTSGNVGLNNTALESIPIASGTWTLSIYDWYPAADNGTLSSWDLCFGAPTPPPPPPTTIPTVCVTGGAAGSFPGVGAANGTWPGTLPTGALVAPLAVTVPAGATKIVSVTINSLAHTWMGDSQIVLQDPSGQMYNLFQINDGVFGGGCADDFAGTYHFVDATLGVDGCGNPANTWTCGGGTLASGYYHQNYGLWPSGSAGISNTDLESIPLASGTWNLVCYDWYVAADGGTVGSWDLCFDAPSGPVAYCTAGTSTHGCVPAISASAQPSVSAAHACSISIANVEGQKFGIIFYGINNTGFSPTPWAPSSTSYLCVKGPTQRTPSVNSNGLINSCNGALNLDWNAYQAANPGAVGNPWSVGNKVYVQGWYRDPPAAKTTNLSDALEMTYQP